MYAIILQIGGRQMKNKKILSNNEEVPPEKEIMQDNNTAGAKKTFPIVGIGASAGGLAAFEAFFSAMPADVDPDMAFVLVQHLAPDHKSILSDLIRRYTRMQVFEVEDGMEVQPNCAYIIPPARDMAFLNGTLQLLEPSAPRGQRLPIDFFFRSLAQDQHERAIGIVFSGTGSDGTLGVRAIKGEGGMVMVQNPESTEYDGMPRSAIATGLVDYQLPPAEMPAQLISYVTLALGKPPHTASPTTPKVENVLKKIFIILRNQTGHDFSLYKPSTVNRRIERRMAVNQIENMDGYVLYLQQKPTEVESLFRDLLIGVTSFFRDVEAFKAFKTQVIPQLFAKKGLGALLRIWVAGCSSGEEAYSIAILMQEWMDAQNESFKVQIFATDIDSQAISAARLGVYPPSIAADLTPERLSRFFAAEAIGTDGNPSAFRIHKSIRDMLVFSEQDIIKDPPFSKLDMISCRNLLIYMGSELQKKLIPLFHYALNPGGFLFLGTSESIGEGYDLFNVTERKQRLYQRKEEIPNMPRDLLRGFLPPMTVLEDTHTHALAKKAQPVKILLRELTEQSLLQQIAPCGALVNAHGDILYIHGRSGKYLEQPQGEVGVNNILKMAREGLRHEITIALNKATHTKEIVYIAHLRVKTNGDFSMVNLSVRKLGEESGVPLESPLFLVLLQDAPPFAYTAELPHNADGDFSLDINKDAQIALLKQELRAKEEYLQASNEELETSNEELKSSNEEMQWVNEELQSTNEELETSKEELQSVNEELATVNAELQTKVVDLSRSNNDMNNLLAGTGIATIFVDYSQRILRFTPASVHIINLIPSDVGRPVGHILSNLIGYNHLQTDIKSVLESLTPFEHTVQNTDGKWFSMQILPYRTIENVIEGAVITFLDITKQVKIEEKLLFNEERLRVALQHSSIVVFNQDKELRYTWVYNPRLGSSNQDILGKTDYDFFQGEDASNLIAIKSQVLENGVGTRKEICLTTNNESVIYDLIVEPLRDISGEIVGITCSSIESECSHSKAECEHSSQTKN